MTTTTKSGTLNQGAYLYRGLQDIGSKFDRLNLQDKIQKFWKSPPKSFKKILIGLAVIILLIAGIWLFRSNTSDTANNDTGDATYVADGPRAQLNKRFEVPIRDSAGSEVGQALVVNVIFLERTEKLLYEGKPLIARSGKDFLVINLEVENSTDNRLTVRPVDFFRLIDTNGKSYAADIQTETVKVEPQSSKKTRTIFIINDDPKRIKLTIGEIKGDNKETVEVNI